MVVQRPYSYRALSASERAGPPPRTPAQQAVASRWLTQARSPLLPGVLDMDLFTFVHVRLASSPLYPQEAPSDWTLLDVLCWPEGPWLWQVERGKVTQAPVQRRTTLAAQFADAVIRFDEALRSRADRWSKLASQPIPDGAGPRTRWFLGLLQQSVQQYTQHWQLLGMADLPTWAEPFEPGSGEARLRPREALLAPCQEPMYGLNNVRLWASATETELLSATPCHAHEHSPDDCPLRGDAPAALLAWMWTALDKASSAVRLETAVEACFRPRWEEALALLAEGVRPEADLPAPTLFWRFRTLSASLIGPIEPILAQVTKNGARKWLKATPAKLAEYGPLREEDALLRERIRSLGLDKRAVRLDGTVLHGLLLTLVDHPRLQDADGEALLLKLGKATLRAKALDKGGAALQLVRPDGRPLPPRASYQPDVADVSRDPQTGTVWIVPWTAMLERLQRATTVSRGEFPPEAVAALTQQLAGLSATVQVDLPESLRGSELAPDERLRVRLHFSPDSGLVIQLRVEPLPGAPLFAPGSGPEVLQGAQHGKPVWTRRNLDAEVDALLALLPLLPELGEEASEATWAISDIDLAIDVLAALDPAPPATVVQWPDPGQRKRVRTAHHKNALKLELSNRRDWFALDGRLRADDVEVPLARVLQALRDGKRFVEIEDGGVLRLADEVRKLLQPLVDNADVDKRGISVSPLAAGLLQELPLDDAPPKPWAEALQRWKQAQALEPVIPAELRAQLRPYQTAGVQWLLRLAHWSPGAVLADDMGLGKTVQTLAVLLARRQLGPQLVVAPLSLLHNWEQEAARFAPDLQLVQLHALASVEGLQPGQVVVASWDRMVRRVDELRQTQWATLVLDEAQNAKNAQTQRAKAAGELPRGYCIALTGTPVENRTSELWSLFSLAVPGLLGGWTWFRDTFAAPIENKRDKAVRNRLAQRIAPFLLRRLKRDVAPELPSRTEVQLDITLSDEERAMYLAHRGAIVQMLAEAKALPPEQRRMQVLAGLTRLRQLACHPQLVEPDCGLGSSKLQVLVERLVALKEEGHRALVFSQFVRHLALVRAELERSGLTIRYLDGQTPQAQRRTEVEAFQAGDGDVFLISLKAGGTGLNLTAASYVFHLDPWWNPAVEDQATDRAHRIGQQQPVTVYRLVADATVESQILQLHADKRALVSDLLDGTGGGGSMDTAELEALLLNA